MKTYLEYELREDSGYTYDTSPVTVVYFHSF